MVESQEGRVEALSKLVGGRFKLTALIQKQAREYFMGGRAFMPGVRNMDELVDYILDEIEDGHIKLELPQPEEPAPTLEFALESAEAAAEAPAEEKAEEEDDASEGDQEAGEEEDADEEEAAEDEAPDEEGAEDEEEDDADDEQEDDASEDDQEDED